jgi:hypothetical protein
MLDKVKRDGKIEPLRRQLKSVYGNDERLGEIGRRRPDRIGRQSRAGVPSPPGVRRRQGKRHCRHARAGRPDPLRAR